jgi:hypothetical protein
MQPSAQNRLDAFLNYALKTSQSSSSAGPLMSGWGLPSRYNSELVLALRLGL